MSTTASDPQGNPLVGCVSKALATLTSNGTLQALTVAAILFLILAIPLAVEAGRL